MQILRIISFCALLGVAVTSAAAQKTINAQNAAPAALAPELKTTGFLYKGVNIGMSADDVRKKLGDPKDKSDPQDLFMFGENESAQFIYGPDKKVTAIMVTYSGNLSAAPTAKDVFGEDVVAKPDGGVSKMVRYPKAGYWVSYNKIAGDDSIISIAMQKMQ